MKKISLLGSTGSIGKTTLEVINKSKQDFVITALSANSNYELLAEQANEFRPEMICISFEKDLKPLKELLKYKPEIVIGEQGLVSIAKNSGADLLLNSLVGAVGLVPTIEAIKAKVDIAIANKETLVVAGSIVTELAKDNNVKLIPVDSEHNAIYQCLKGNEDRQIDSLILTASGGPLLNHPLDTLSQVTPQDALKHPTWGMGKKISIDSATMVNKCLEIIEAKWLFDISIDQIDVVIHPQSIVHGMVEYKDGSCIAMMAPTSMSIPVLYALYFPLYAPQSPVNLLKGAKGLSLDFIAPDLNRFPVLKTAIQVGKTCGSSPAVFNAAHEVAVQAFLDGRIRFNEIVEIIEKVLDKHENVQNVCLDILLETDKWARTVANTYCN